MMSFTDSQAIAYKIFTDLNIPEDIYKTWTRGDQHKFFKQYLENDDYIGALVDIELANYDTSDMVPYDIEDIRMAAIDEVIDQLERIYDNYNLMQEQIRDTAYASILSALYNANLENVVDIDEEVDPADPDVGIFGEERRIVFTLSNDSTITFVVDD